MSKAQSYYKRRRSSARQTGDNSKRRPLRRALMKVLTGEERPLAKCGVHALEAAYRDFRKTHPKEEVADTRKGAKPPAKANGKVGSVKVKGRALAAKGKTPKGSAGKKSGRTLKASSRRR